MLVVSDDLHSLAQRSSLWNTGVINYLSSWLVNVDLPSIKHTEVWTTGMNFGACRLRKCVLDGSVANSSAHTLS
jgi:hypothetical protein